VRGHLEEMACDGGKWDQNAVREAYRTSTGRRAVVRLRRVEGRCVDGGDRASEAQAQRRSGGEGGEEAEGGAHGWR
jgi:hypothetical protein